MMVHHIKVHLCSGLYLIYTKSQNNALHCLFVYPYVSVSSEIIDQFQLTKGEHYMCYVCL